MKKYFIILLVFIGGCKEQPHKQPPQKPDTQYILFVSGSDTIKLKCTGSYTLNVYSVPTEGINLNDSTFLVKFTRKVIIHDTDLHSN